MPSVSGRTKQICTGIGSSKGCYSCRDSEIESSCRNKLGALGQQDKAQTRKHQIKRHECGAPSRSPDRRVSRRQRLNRYCRQTQSRSADHEDANSHYGHKCYPVPCPRIELYEDERNQPHHSDTQKVMYCVPHNSSSHIGSTRIR